MISQTIFLQGDIQARRSANQFGTLIWQLNEIWPTGGWGSLEYGNIVCYNLSHSVVNVFSSYPFCEWASGGWKVEASSLCTS